MPLYEYHCSACDLRYERIQSFNAPPQIVCPNCGARIERVLSVPAVHFKGSGFHATDYGKGGAK